MSFAQWPADGKQPWFFKPEDIIRSKQIFRIIERLPSQLDGACFFGAGAIGKSLVWHFRQAGLRVTHFIDNNSELWGTEVVGLPVVSPEEHALRHYRRPLVVALSHGFRSVCEQCRNLGLSVIPHYLCRSALGICPFGKRLAAEEIENTREAGDALNIWNDEASREKYRLLVRFHALFDEAALPAAEAGHYFNPAYMPRRYLRSVADVGACDGDTLREFLQVTGGNFAVYYAFEPDPFNADAIAAEFGAADRRIHIFNLALGEKAGKARMRSFASLLSNIAEDGDVIVPMETLDNLLGDADIDLIKIDVEGFESSVLTGMQKIVHAKQPALAVSVYHQVDHLWSLPLWIKNAGFGYRLKLGCHSDLYSEAVCYALPPGAS